MLASTCATVLNEGFEFECVFEGLPCHSVCPIPAPQPQPAASTVPNVAPRRHLEADPLDGAGTTKATAPAALGHSVDTAFTAATTHAADMSTPASARAASA